jgi:hypothetical protein
MSSISFIRYYKTTGAIRFTGRCQSHMLSAQSSATETSIEGIANQRTQYVDVVTETLLPRPAGTLAADKAAAAVGEDITLTGVELGDTITVLLDGAVVDQFPFTVPDSVIAFASAGDYVINAQPRVKLASEVLVNVT